MRGEVEEKQELLEIDEEQDEGGEEIKEDRETLTSCMDEMRQTLGHLEQHDACKE